MISIYKSSTEQNCIDFCHGFVNQDGKKIKGINGWLKKRVKNTLSVKNLSHSKNRLNKKLLQDLYDKLTDDEINRIISCPKEDLVQLSQEYAIYNISIYEKIGHRRFKKKNVLDDIFNYNTFRTYKSGIYNGYLLAATLNIKCCPYCNRNYTTQHETLYYQVGEYNVRSKLKHVFPEFDHFYAREHYPLLAICFYNLIPSCGICNTHYKGSRDTYKFNLLHPYTKISENAFSFKIIPSDTSTLYGAANNYSIDFDFNDSDIINIQLRKSIDFFDIKANYELNHQNFIREIIGKKIMFSNTYLKVIEETYGISHEESYRILFESYLEETLLHHRPFSKLKKDIFKSTNI